jgi:hypothetical protein
MTAKLPVEDRLDILELYARYGDAEDEGDVEALLATFTSLGVLEDSIGLFSGQAELRQSFQGRIAMLRSKRHLTFNHVITAEDDPESATVECRYLLVEAERAPALVDVGTYVDQLRKIEGEWKFVHRKVKRRPVPGVQPVVAPPPPHRGRRR